MRSRPIKISGTLNLERHIVLDVDPVLWAELVSDHPEGASQRRFANLRYRAQAICALRFRATTQPIDRYGLPIARCSRHQPDDERKAKKHDRNAEPERLGHDERLAARYRQAVGEVVEH